MVLCTHSFPVQARSWLEVERSRGIHGYPILADAGICLLLLDIEKEHRTGRMFKFRSCEVWLSMCMLACLATTGWQQCLTQSADRMTPEVQCVTCFPSKEKSFVGSVRSILHVTSGSKSQSSHPYTAASGGPNTAARCHASLILRGGNTKDEEQSGEEWDRTEVRHPVFLRIHLTDVGTDAAYGATSQRMMTCDS